MRITWKNWQGRKIVKEFERWDEMCIWLKRFYPFVASSVQIGQWLDRH